MKLNELVNLQQSLERQLENCRYKDNDKIEQLLEVEKQIDQIKAADNNVKLV